MNIMGRITAVDWGIICMDAVFPGQNSEKWSSGSGNRNETGEDTLMIYDLLDNFSMYLCLHTQFPDTLAFLKDHEGCLHMLRPGSYDINNLGAFVSISEYESKPESEGFLEYHRKFIDIQIVVTGREKIGIAQTGNCRDQAYLEEKDMGKLIGIADHITLDRTNFAIFFPQDAHMPQISCSERRERVKKMVFKIPILT